MIAYKVRVRARERLHPRLRAIAELVPVCTSMADIGTDHALLPVSLLAAGRVERAIAADIGEGPLAHAARTVARHEFEHVIRLRQANGLFAVD
ncbi:MAG: tRNA (adenine(22)-N(1))-methyltransferase TrmK, partial [Nannocystaceae bacterium]